MTNASPEATRARLEQVVSDSVACALGLKKVLADERDALERRDADVLRAVTKDKDRQILKLSTLEQARVRICTDAGFDAAPEAMQSVADWCDEHDRILKEWAHLREIAQDLDDLNLTNGAIIRLRRQQIAEGLALIRGDERASDIYGADGASSPAAGGRPLTEA